LKSDYTNRVTATLLFSEVLYGALSLFSLYLFFGVHLGVVAIHGHDIEALLPAWKPEGGVLKLLTSVTDKPRFFNVIGILVSTVHNLTA